MAPHNNEQTASELAGIRINMIEERSGQILRNYLLDGLNPRGVPASPRYFLDVRLTEPRQEVAIRRDATAGRIGYTANASFSLLDLTGKSVFSGTSSSSSTYEVTNSEYASIAGQRSARDRAMEDISVDIRMQLASFLLRAHAPPAE